MTTNKWVIDPTHSEVQFRVKHLMLSNVTGRFNTFAGTVETEDDDFSKSKVHFTADVNSISTNNEQRDTHLRTGDFFDAEKHPKLLFESNRLVQTDDGHYKVSGQLTLRGVTKEVTLDAQFGGIVQDPWGNTRTGFTLSGKLHRKDFGVSFGLVNEAGGLALGDEVTISADVQFVKQAMAQAA